MSKTLDNLRKRRGTSIEIDGDTFYVRALTIGESDRVTRLFPVTVPHENDTPEQSAERQKQHWRRTAYTIGCYLCDDLDGTPTFPRLADETAEQWADRIVKELDDIEGDKIRALSEKVVNLGNAKNGKPVSVETLVKN